jgi:hypothetical protein
VENGLIRGMVSQGRDNMVVFYYLNAFEIWPDKSDGRGFIREDYCTFKFKLLLGI